MKVEINQQTDEIYEKNIQIEKLKKELVRYQEPQSTKKVSVDSQTIQVRIMNKFIRINVAN